MNARVTRCVSWCAIGAMLLAFGATDMAAQPLTPINTNVPIIRDTATVRVSTVELPMMERNYFGQPFPNDKVGSWFEGYLAVHLPVMNRYARSLDSAYQQRGHTKTGQALTVSMLVNLRMTREASAPVRTPSYMPRVRYQVTRTKRPNDDGAIAQWIVDGTFGHYSNGQDGCLFEGQALPDCTFTTPVAEKNLRTNRRDGSFSSHYLEAGLTRRWIITDNAMFTDDRVRARTVTHVGVRVRDYQALSGIGGGMVRELREVYGASRVRVYGGRNWERNTHDGTPGQWWLEGFVEALPGRAPQVDPVRMALEFGRSFDRLDGLGVFVRAYSGQDDYNLGFLTNLRVVHVGVAVGGEGRASFRQ